MPKYRQLHTKLVDSQDIADMPDDFTRLLYLTFIVILDSGGKAIDNPAWIRSKAFPLREDVTLEQIKTAMDWYEQRGQIVRYEIGGKKYFICPKFIELQSGLEKELKSNIPNPPAESLRSNSGITLESLRSQSVSIQCNAIQDNSIQIQDNDAANFEKVPVSNAEEKAWNMALGELLKSGIPKNDFDTWIKPLVLAGVNNNVIHVQAANNYGAELVKSRYGKTLSGYVSGYFGRPVEIAISV